MKTILISLVTMVTTIGAFANIDCPIGCPVHGAASKILAVSSLPSNVHSFATSFSSETENISNRMARLTDATEDLKSLLNYNQAMVQILNRLETEKHLDAMEDLTSETAFSKLMTNTLIQIEQNKLEEKLEDGRAMVKYSNLMELTLQAVKETK